MVSLNVIAIVAVAAFVAVLVVGVLFYYDQIALQSKQNQQQQETGNGSVDKAIS